jgi:hypothetical protein
MAATRNRSVSSKTAKELHIVLHPQQTQIGLDPDE